MIVVDNFAGGGGASTGIEAALGRPIDYAINHDAEAIAMHRANHPLTTHLCESVWDVDPRQVARGRQVGLGWFSPDCTFHSKARGGKPFRDRNRARRQRGLAGIVPRWLSATGMTVFMLENVEEFSDWGPLLPDGRICPKRRGMLFRRWHRQIENIVSRSTGKHYRIDMRELIAAEYGAPTTRKRLFVIGRCDDGEIVFPEAMHGPGLLPYRTAADCIDWSIPCPSIFERQRPLAEATLRRIARGVMRYVVNNPRPFIVPITHTGSDRVNSIDEPLRTITTAHRGELAVCTPFIAGLAHGEHRKRPGDRNRGVDEPLRTVHAGGNNFALVAPTLINTRNGEREGQKPRCRDIEAPFPTVTAIGSQGALVAAFLAQHNGGMTGRFADKPLSTIVGRGTQQQLVASHIVKLKGTSRDGQPVTEPLHTVQAGGLHYGEVRAFLMSYYGTDQAPRLDGPAPTVRTRDHLGLVTVHGEPYAIVDIGMRMLTPRELFRAQGFRDGYVIDPEFEGKPLTKTSQVRMAGNSVCPPVAEALVRANVIEQRRENAA